MSLAASPSLGGHIGRWNTAIGNESRQIGAIAIPIDAECVGRRRKPSDPVAIRRTFTLSTVSRDTEIVLPECVTLHSVLLIL